jgi:hypothetical protein
METIQENDGWEKVEPKEKKGEFKRQRFAENCGKNDDLADETQSRQQR